MANHIGSGLSATRGLPTDPDMTFVWNAEKTPKTLKVTVLYGGGTATNNKIVAEIPLGSREIKPIGPGDNPQIQVDGSLEVCWGDPANRSYFVMFRGRMVRPHVNDIVGSNKTATEVARPIIVYADLG